MKKRENDAADFRLFCLPELRRVKLTFLFILLACMQVSARSQEKITVNLQSADLKKALAVIERKSDYHFLYNESVIANKPKIDLNVKDAEITAVLDKILVANGISYRILNSNLVVLKAIGDDSKTVIPDIRVSGKVTGTNGVALAGVSITIKGTNAGTTTDDNGNFSITVPDENSVLVFSYVGYTVQEIVVGNQTSLNISLQASTSTLDQIVVVGYGAQRKRDLTGAYASIRGNELARQPVQTPTQALQGKVAGVQVVSSGEPNSLPSIRLRGTGSVLAGVNPLYVVDGVLTDDIRNINNADILTFDVLKDASATAIYGVRGANGVIIITTKKGRPGKTVFSYDGNVGIKEATNLVDMAGENQYAGYL
ncbi:MAG TPA: carboxypeptidase-like regulatory domain-containing protein, partial [Flavisolibacter sp.]|nr:carboxypeptidase-like regulatory domain-containing protein [Flavisolibacter sp.]